MLDTNNEWNSLFIENARHEPKRSIPALPGAPERARRRAAEQQTVDRRERLRRHAVRLTRQAGVRGIKHNAFSDRTTAQLQIVIDEARAVLDAKIRN